MKNLKPTENDASHDHTAIPTYGVFEVPAASKREKTGIEKESEAPFYVKFKYALPIQLYMCFNERVGNLKKNP